MRLFTGKEQRPKYARVQNENNKIPRSTFFSEPISSSFFVLNCRSPNCSDGTAMLMCGIIVHLYGAGLDRSRRHPRPPAPPTKKDQHFLDFMQFLGNFEPPRRILNSPLKSGTGISTTWNDGICLLSLSEQREYFYMISWRPLVTRLFSTPVLVLVPLCVKGS